MKKRITSYCVCSEQIRVNRARPTDSGSWECTFCDSPLDPEATQRARERFLRRYGRFENSPI